MIIFAVMRPGGSILPAVPGEGTVAAVLMVVRSSLCCPSTGKVECSVEMHPRSRFNRVFSALEVGASGDTTIQHPRVLIDKPVFANHDCTACHNHVHIKKTIDR